MKISNVTILSTDLANNTAKISFTISEATENVNIYLKINNEEYKVIFLNKANGNLEYTTKVSRGVNNLLLKATDSTTEYISEPIQVLLKETPTIENLECSYSDSTGKYILNFAFNGDTNFKYNIYLKLDVDDYIEVLSNQISGDKTIEQTSTMGEHTCILKVSDGYDDYTFSSFQFEITNRKPILSKVLVTDIANNGEAYIYYSTKDIESSTLTHKLVIGTTETAITPTQVDNFYSYKITGLSEGISNCTINISDGIDVVSSDVFSIEVFSDTTDKKELLRRAKVRYDSAYQQLRDIIVSVISDLKYDYDIENALIAKAQDNYKIEYSNFNKISQQSIDTIGSNKVKVTKQELQSEINDVDSAVNSLETTMWGVFQDGILDQSERDTLSNSLDLVAKEKSDIDRDYETLYNNEDLTDLSKTKLQTNYNNFINAHNSLATTINNIINKEGIIDNTDKTNIDTAFENWRTALGNYRTASLEAIDAIAKKKADDSADVVDKKWAEIVLDPETGIKTQVGNLQTKITGEGGIENRLQSAEQTLTKDGISNIVKDVYYTKTEVDNKVTNVDNKIKVTVKSVNVMYYLSTSTTELSGGTWTDVAPTWEANKYMWSKTVTTLSDGTIKESSPTCIAGAKGQDGVPGTNGKDGVTTYTWIKYADDSNGNGISNNPTGKEYIGFAYNKTTATESNVPSDYMWSLIKGTDGIDGTNGVDGVTYYTWIKYSDNADGTGLYDTPNSQTKYIGIATNKTTATESTNKTDYVWSKFRGEDGTDGKGVTSIVNYYRTYTSDKGLTNASSGFSTTVPTMDSTNKYLWSYELITYTDNSSAKTSARVIGMYSTDGTNGRGISSITEYYAVGTSNTTAPTNFSTKIPTMDSINKYLWNYEVITYTDNTTKTTDKRVIGVYGETGATGTGIESITEEYYLSTSKTTQTGGSWVTTPPTWEYGKYVWTRSKIVYKDPASTVYTTPMCDSSWEAVNEIEIGGRNLASEKNISDATVLPINDNNYSFLGNTAYTKNNTTANENFIYVRNINVEPNTEYTISFYAKKESNCKGIDVFFLGKSSNYTGRPDYEYTHALKQNIGTTTWTKYSYTFTTASKEVNGYIRFDNNGCNNTSITNANKIWIAKIKMEKGNKATDWTPAPEDIQSQIDFNKAEIKTTKETVAEHTTSLNSITSRVSATESTITTIQNKVNIAIKEVYTMYYLSTSSTQLIDGAWSRDVPSDISYNYLWTKTVTVYVNGTTSESDPICNTAMNGEDGEPGYTVILSDETFIVQCDLNGDPL